MSNLEAATGFEPVIRVLQTRALPLGYAAKKKSGKRDSDPRHSAWEADALPTELFPHTKVPTRLDSVQNINDGATKINGYGVILFQSMSKRDAVILTAILVALR